jgi:hypothetical protein
MTKSIQEMLGEPFSTHKLVYDSGTETLEPVYFFLLDLMNDFGLGPQKLVDNFASSPGSGHFGELGQRLSVMQQQGTKLLGDINTVLRSVLNLLYDLKDFKTRLQAYDDLDSKDKSTSHAARLSLKQIWMDKVDAPQKGNSSLKAMGLGQAGFQTLIDAFLAADTAKDVDKMDLNLRIKRILHPRVHEFNSWLESSETELNKRYEIEKTYLKSQVNSLNLYSRWAKPYLRAASQLESKYSLGNAELVKTFNTIMLDLALLGKHDIEIEDEVAEGTFPPALKSSKDSKRRKYHAITLVEFQFRGIPQRVQQQSHFTFGGRAEITFSSYALNEEELNKAVEEIKESELGDVLSLIEGATEESIGQLKDEIDFFLEDDGEIKKDKKGKKKIKKKGTGEVNPFLALTGYYNKGDKKESKQKKENKDKKIAKDNWVEKTYLRTIAATKSQETTFKLFDIYKKSHGMPSYS